MKNSFAQLDPVLLNIAVVYIAIGVALLCGWLSAKSLPRRLRTRPVMEFDEWFDKYYPDSKLDKDTVLKIQQLLVELFHNVHPTQILPTDRFAVELALPKLAIKIGVGAEVNYEGVMYFLMDRGVDPEELATCQTVAQLTEAVCRLVAGKQPRGEKSTFLSVVTAIIIVAVLVGAVTGGAWAVWNFTR